MFITVIETPTETPIVGEGCLEKNRAVGDQNLPAESWEPLRAFGFSCFGKSPVLAAGGCQHHRHISDKRELVRQLSWAELSWSFLWAGNGATGL